MQPRFTAEVGKDDPVILICRTGNRTDKQARVLMEEQGYTQVYNVRTASPAGSPGITLG
ncbi:MAG: hypothetical protein Q8K12_12395 [Thiobacillus sp.]|nr:hypothetical protein [Thiobacillus sp.]